MLTIEAVAVFGGEMLDFLASEKAFVETDDRACACQFAVAFDSSRRLSYVRLR